MPPMTSGLGIESMDLAHFELILFRMIMAGLLGAFLGYRLWRRYRQGGWQALRDRPSTPLNR